MHGCAIHIWCGVYVHVMFVCMHMFGVFVYTLTVPVYPVAWGDRRTYLSQDVEPALVKHGWTG